MSDTTDPRSPEPPAPLALAPPAPSCAALPSPRIVALAAAMTLAFAVTATVAPRAARADHHAAKDDRQSPALRTTEAIDFRDQMRKLWEDHVTWTRMVIVSLAADLPDLPLAVGRLLANQDDIGAAFRPSFGAATAAELTALLRAHVAGAADLLTAAKAGDADAVAAASARWYANGRDIASFLHRINRRQWAEDEMQEMMKEHLDLTLAEAVARLSGDFAGDIAAYEAVHLAILDMADMLSFGIIRAFPRRF